MKKNKLLILIIIILLCTINIPNSQNIPNHIYTKITGTITKDKEEYARLLIPKISINHELYTIDSPANNVDKNITILKESITPDQNNSIMIIAAHSGTGDIAYFERLNELELNDEITLIYQNKKYLYKVKDIFEQKKNGYIHINKESQKQLVLTTCSPTKKEYQLIVNCTEKESN